VHPRFFYFLKRSVRPTHALTSLARYLLLTGDTSVLQINDREMTGNLDSKIVSIDSYLKVEMAGKCGTFMYLFLCTT
jgi:hypothetical protein